MSFRFLMPWLRSDIRLTGRFAVHWLKGFERIAGAGEELSGYDLVATFPEEPPKTPIRVLIDVNGRKLSARIVAQKVDDGGKGQFKCRCKFSLMGPREQRELTEVLENAPSPPYKRERIEPPKRSPMFKRRPVRRNIVVPPEIEGRIVTILVGLQRLAQPAGTQRPLIAVKEEQPLTEDGVSGKAYRVRSRIVNSHGVTKTFDTSIFVPERGEARVLD